jgi:RND family efflux transporter MFP subunit
LIPLVLVGGFVALVAWAARDWIFPPRPVTTVQVYSSRGTIAGARGELFRAAGWVEPRPTPIRVAALAPGVIRRLLVVEDQAVRADEPVAELVDEDAKLAVQRAEANIKLREAELAIAQAVLAAAELRHQQPVHLQAALGEAEAQLAEIATAIQSLPFELRQAEAKRDFAKLDHERKLSADDSVSKRAVDEAKSQWEAAQAAVDQLQQREMSLQAQHSAWADRCQALRTQLELLIDETRAMAEAAAGVRAAEARLAQSQVEWDEATLRLQRMVVRSPVDGHVFRLHAHPGASVGMSTTHSVESDGSTVISLYQPESLQVRADVRFENLPLVQLGQRVEIANPALTKSLSGKVLFINSEADIQKNTLEVKIAIDQPAELLKPQMLVDATFLADEDHAAPESAETARIFAPRRLVLAGADGAFVWVANQRLSTAEKIPVATGVQLGDLVEITRGLNASHRLIDSGFETLRDGQRIQIVESPERGGSPTPDVTKHPNE